MEILLQSPFTKSPKSAILAKLVNLGLTCLKRTEKKENFLQKMLFLTVVACEIGRNRYFAGTDQRTGSGVWWELWLICRAISDPLGICISLDSAFFAYFFFLVNFSPWPPWGSGTCIGFGEYVPSFPKGFGFSCTAGAQCVFL